MQAVIMAAGRSTRTHPLTERRPKPLLPLWDRPLLEHQLRQLEGLAEEVLLVVGYLRERIEARFGDSFGRMRLAYILQTEQRGTADALRAASARVEGPVLVLNGDDFYHREDLMGLAATGRGLLVTRASDPQNRAVVTLDGDRVTDIIEKPEHPPEDAWCSVGGYFFEEGDLGRLDEVPLSPRGELELPDFVRALVHSTTVRARRIERVWLPLTYSWDALGAMLFLWERPERARDLGLASESAESIRARTDLRIGADVVIEGPVHLGPGVTLSDGARLRGPLSIGAGSTVSAGAELERSAIFEDVFIGAGARVRDSVLGSGVSVGASARLESRAGAELAIEVKGRRVVPGIPRLGTVAGDFAIIEAGAVVPPGTILPAR